MLDRLIEIGSSVIRLRDETVQERADTLDSLYKQVLEEGIGSERSDMAFQAYRWLKRAPERRVIELLGRPLPIWFPPSRKSNDLNY